MENHSSETKENRTNIRAENLTIEISKIEKINGGKSQYQNQKLHYSETSSWRKQHQNY